MRNVNGFTLVELLVAATIVGILAVFATTQYRNSVAETRWTQAKAHAEQLFVAAQRALVDYPFLSFSGEPMSGGDGHCDMTPGVTSVSSGDLIPCGYLENSGWADSPYFEYYVCQGTGKCKTSYDLVCVNTRSGAKLPDKYKSYQYCLSMAFGGKEYH